MKSVEIYLSKECLFDSLKTALQGLAHAVVTVSDNKIVTKTPVMKGTVRHITTDAGVTMLAAEMDSRVPVVWELLLPPGKPEIYLLFNMGDSHAALHNRGASDCLLQKDMNDTVLIMNAAEEISWEQEPGVSAHFLLLAIPQRLISLMYSSMGQRDSTVMNLLECEKRSNICFRASMEMKRMSRDIVCSDMHNDWEMLYLKGLVYKLLLSLLGHRLESSEWMQYFKNDELKQLSAAKNLLIKDLSVSAPKVEELARMSLMSKSKFKSMFKKVYGMNCYEFHRDRRLEMARQLLESKKYTVSQVAYEIGYINLGYFSRAFKRKYKVLPKVYLKGCLRPDC